LQFKLGKPFYALETTASAISVAMSILCPTFETLSKFTALPDGELKKAVNDADVVLNVALT